MPKVRIVLADDHTVMRSGLKLLLEREAGFTVVGEAQDGREAVRTVDEQSPDVVVMDVAMPNLNGIEATVRIVDSHPRTAVIILSMHSDEGYVLRALKAGARGYLLKDSAESDLIEAVRKVSEEKVLQLVQQNTQGPLLGLFGTERVNVLKLNIALDALK